MKIVGICQIFNEVASGNLVRALKHYKFLCDEMIILDDASTDSPKTIVEKYTSHYIRNDVNQWEQQRETWNKSKLLECAKDIRADWVINFDADEIFERSFTRDEIEELLWWSEGHAVDAYRFFWTNFWLSPALVRTDGGLNTISPPRIYRVYPQWGIVKREGLHQTLWPFYADKAQLIPCRLLHFSSASVMSLVGKIVRYCLLDKRYPTIADRKQRYLDNLLQGVCVRFGKGSWFDGRDSLWFQKDIQEIIKEGEEGFLTRGHLTVKQFVEEKLMGVKE